jgi:hypothetical protein
MDNQELNREMKKYLDSLQDVPERDLQASHVGRENYLAQVRSLKPRKRVLRKTSQQRTPAGRRSWVTRFAAVAAVIVVALSSLGGTIYAAQAAQPDDFLYGVKTWTEEIQVQLEEDPEDKLDLYVSFANRRIEEIQTQAAAGQLISEKALDLLEQHTRQMLEQAAKLSDFGMNKALRQIEENLQLQNQLMAELGKEYPQGFPPGLLKTQEKIRQRLELVENAIEEPAGFQEQLQQEQMEQQGEGNEPSNPDAPQGDPNNDPDGGQNGTDTPGSGSGNGQGGK